MNVGRTVIVGAGVNVGTGVYDGIAVGDAFGDGVITGVRVGTTVSEGPGVIVRTTAVPSTVADANAKGVPSTGVVKPTGPHSG